MLLTAMFMASCYWSPVPLDTPLSRPWSDNITTFGEALLSIVPDLPLDMNPSAIPIVDRCWCDFSTGFFEPFNSTRWEWNSVERLRVSLERQLAARNSSAPLLEDAGDAEGEGVAEAANGTAGFGVLSSAMSTFTAVQQRLGLVPANLSALDATSEPPPIAQLFASASANDSTARTLSKVWREYDLRPYGFDMIVDLGWPQSP